MYCLKDCGDKMNPLLCRGSHGKFIELKTYIPVSVIKVTNICEAERVGWQCLCFCEAFCKALPVLLRALSGRRPQWSRSAETEMAGGREREREIVCECERKRRRRAVKTEEVKCSLVHHTFLRDLKQTDAVTVRHLTQDTCFVYTLTNT